MLNGLLYERIIAIIATCPLPVKGFFLFCMLLLCTSFSCSCWGCRLPPAAHPRPNLPPLFHILCPFPFSVLPFVPFSSYLILFGPLLPPIDTFLRFVGNVLHILKRRIWVLSAHSNRASLRDAVISFFHFQVAFFAWSSEGLAGAAGAAFLLVFSLTALCFFVASACTRVPTSRPFSPYSMPVFPLCPSLCPLSPPFGSLLNLSCPQIFLLSDCFFPFYHV